MNKYSKKATTTSFIFCLLSIICFAFLLMGCKVNLNTKTEISYNDDYQISATVLEINESIDTAWTQKVSFYILFQNNMPSNMTGINLNIYDFDISIDGYTTFDIYMTNDNGYNITNTTLNPGEFLHITLYAVINKTTLTEKITDNKIDLQYNQTTIFSNY